MPQHYSEEDEVHFWFEAWKFNAEVSVVSELMQLQPTKVMVAGEPNFKHPPGRKNHWNLWTFDSPLPMAAPTEEHLEVLISVLEPRAEAIATLVEVHQAEVGFRCVIHYRDWTPGIRFSPDIMRRLGNLNLAVELNLYLREEEA